MDGTEQGCPALVRQPKAQYPCFRDRSHRCRCRSFVAAHRLAPRPLAPLLPLPVWAQRCCTPTRCRPTFSVQRSTFNSSRLSPLASPPRAIAPAAGLGAALLRPYTLSSHVQRATCNLSTPHASRPSPRPLAPLLPLPVWAQRCCAPTRCRPTCNVQRATFQLLSPLAPPRTTVYRGRWHGTAPQVPHTAAIPPASDCAAGGGRPRRSGHPGATTIPAPFYPHSR